MRSLARMFSWMRLREEKRPLEAAKVPGPEDQQDAKVSSQLPRQDSGHVDNVTAARFSSAVLKESGIYGPLHIFITP